MPRWLPIAAGLGLVWYLWRRSDDASGDGDGDGDRGDDGDLPPPQQRAGDAVEAILAGGVAAAARTNNAVSSVSVISTPNIDACRPRANWASCREFRWLWTESTDDAGAGPGGTCSRKMKAVGIPLGGDEDGEGFFAAFRSDQFQTFSGLHCVNFPSVHLFITSVDRSMAFAVDTSIGAVVENPGILLWTWRSRGDEDPRDESCWGAWDSCGHFCPDPGYGFECGCWLDSHHGDAQGLNNKVTYWQTRLTCEALGAEGETWTYTVPPGLDSARRVNLPEDIAFRPAEHMSRIHWIQGPTRVQPLVPTWQSPKARAIESAPGGSGPAGPFGSAPFRGPADPANAVRSELPIIGGAHWAPQRRRFL